jgi:peroxiredoxin
MRRSPSDRGILVLLLLGLGLPVSACAVEGVSDRPAWNAEVTVDAPARGRPLGVGEAVPDFSALGLDGRRVAWTEALGHPTVLIVWASWCPHCQRVVPQFGRAAAEFPTVTVLTVTTSIGRHPGPSPEEFARRFALPFPIALDDRQNTLAHALGVYRIPMIYWIGPDGRVLAVTEGESDETRIREGFRVLAALAH